MNERHEFPVWRTTLFKHRGAVLALPAIALVAFGKPSRRSIAAGVPLALAGEALRCWAVGYSGRTTRADTVTAPALVTAGPYAHVRNPLYLGNLLTAAGFALAFTGGLGPGKRVLLSGFGIGTMLAVYAGIVPLEEAYLRETFGEAFDDYAARVPRIVPRLTTGGFASGEYDATTIVEAESRTFASFAAMLAALALKAARA